MPKKEKGCVDPLYGNKSKCVIKIVPQQTKCETFQMNDKCKTMRLEKKDYWALSNVLKSFNTGRGK